MAIVHPKYIVGIGGSAGGLSAYKGILDALGSTTGMAFVIISHMNPTASSYLAEILTRHTEMPVEVASMAMPIRKNHVYVIPPNSDLLVDGYKFKVISPRDIKKKQVNLFLISLAEVMGARAIGVIVSGYGDDGTEGCKQIQAKGGITFAQDESAEVNQMPYNAYVADHVNFVLPPNKIAIELKKLARSKNQRALMPTSP